MTYEILLQHVQKAQRENKHKNFPKPERDLISLILFELSEGIQKERLPRPLKYVKKTQLVEIKLDYGHIYLMFRHRGNASLVKAQKLEPKTKINEQLVIDSIEAIGLQCEVRTEGRRIDKLFAIIELEA